MAKKKARLNRTNSSDWKTLPLTGQTLCITGSIQFGGRKELSQLIEAHGGKLLTSVSAKLNVLIVGQSGSKKSTSQTKAESLNKSGKANITIVRESVFHQLLIPERDVAIAMLKAKRLGIEQWNALFGHQWLQICVDISGTDFKKCDLRNADLRNANVDGCDFSEAKLSDVKIAQVTTGRFDKATGGLRIQNAVSCSFKNARLNRSHMCNGCSITATDSNFDGASFNGGAVYGLVNSSAKKANLDGVRLNPADFSGADLTAAKLANVCGYYTTAIGTVFDKAKMRKAELEQSKFKAASFRNTDLSGAILKNSDLSGADLTGAVLNQADLSECNLSNANLTKASLRNVRLSNANLSRAKFDGADMTGAGVVGAKLTAAQIKAAKGLKTDDTKSGKAGKNIRQLQKVAKDSKKLTVTLRVEQNKSDYVICSVRSWASSWGKGTDSYENICTKNSSLSQPGPGNTIATCMIGLANRWSSGTPRFDLIEVSGTKLGMKKKELTALAVAAWCEAFGVDVPTEKQIHASRRNTAATAKSDLEKAIDGLRNMKTGVAKWNKLVATRQQAKAIGPLRKLELNNVKIPKVRFRELDLQGSNFSGSDLTSADFGITTLKKCNFDSIKAQGAIFAVAKSGDATFRNADLRNANLRASNFLRVSFSGAKLDGADFTRADLKGADFSNASMKQLTFGETKFDQTTIFPADFELVDGLKWAGAGKDPRLVTQIQNLPSETLSFDGLMNQLDAGIDASRLKKAMKMLKSDRFQLFAEVDAAALTGVVKSQSDSKLVYSCRLNADGGFSCCNQNLNVCGGLRGALCKHLLVLVIGLTKAGEINPTTANLWVEASKLQKPNLDKDLMSETLLKFKGAEAGEIDWRPTETVPEDFMAF